MDFGLGLILSFTDNATAGINNAVNGLNQLTGVASRASSGMASLSALSVVSGQLGDTFTRAGTGILGMFTGLLSQVQNTGSEFENFKTTLDSLYQDEEKATSQLNKLLDFSVKSPFEIDQVKDMLVVLKSQGIDAFGQMTSAAGDFQQENLAWIADLMAFKPDEATFRWKRALTNFLGSGQDLMLRNILDMGDIEKDVLGHSMGATAEERMKNLREIVEKVNLQGYAEKMSHTMTGVASNVDDAMTRIYKSIADTGVFENLKSSFMSFKGVLLSMSGEELSAIGTTIGEALNTLLKPLTILAEKFNEAAHKIVAFAQTHPRLVKIGIVLTAVAGIFLVFIGVVLKATSAMSGLSLMLIASGKQFSSLGTLFRSGALKILGVLAPLAIAFGMIYVAWKKDLGGIASSLKGFVTNVVASFNTARSLVGGSVEDIQTALKNLNPDTNFFDGLTIAIMKVMVVGKALVEGWNNFELSEDTFRKVEALGLKPLVSTLFDLLYRFRVFKEGFVEGMRSVLDAVHGFFTELANSVKGTVFEDFFNKVTGFFAKLTNNDPEAWRKTGKVIGEIATSILLVVGAIKALGIVLKPVRALGGIISTLFGGHGGGSGGGGGPLGNPISLLKALGSMAIIVGGVTLLLVALGSLITNQAVNTFLSNGLSVINRLFDSLLALAASVGVLAVLFKAINLIRLSPAEALKGIADLAIILMGLEFLVIAVGAVASIPGFNNFISNGAETMKTLVGVLESMFNPKALIVMGLIAAFGLVPISAVLTGIANLALVLAGLTLLISAFSLLSMIPGFNDFISNGGEALSNLFLQVGRIVGSFVGGIAAGATDGLPIIGQNLSEFAANVRPFFDIINSTNTEKIPPFIDSLSRFILFSMGEQILSFFTGGIDLISLAQQLTSFATAAAPFFNMVSTFPDSGIEKAPKVFDAITSVGNYAFRTGGVAQFFTGEVDITRIASQLSSAAPDLGVFFNSVAGFSESGIEKAPKVFDAITSVGKYSFRSGGVAQFFTGEVDIAGIASQLATAAPDLRIFFNAASGFSDKGIEKAPKVFDAITSIGKYSFRSGGVAQFFTGEVDIEGMANQLANASQDLRTFFNAVASYSATGIERAPKVFDALTSIGDYDFKSGGVAQWFTGSVDLKDIGGQLTEFGEAAKGFFDVMGSVSTTGMANGQKALESLTYLGTFKSGGLFDWFTGTISLDSIGGQLSSFATNIKPFFTTAAGISTTAITRANQIFESLGNMGYYSFRAGGVAQLFTGEVNLTTLGQQLSGFAANIKPFYDVTGALSSTAIKNAEDMFTSLENAGSLVTAANSSRGKLTSFGEELVGFAGNFNTFVNTLSTTGDTSSVSALIDTLTNLDSSLSTLSSSLDTSITSITGSFTTLQSSFTETVTVINTQTNDLSTAVTTALGTIQTNTTDTVTAITTTVDTFAGNTKTTIEDLMGNVELTIDTGWGNIESRFNTAGNTIQASVTTVFNGVNTTITSAMATAKSTVSTALTDMQNQFANTVFKFNQNIALPHFTMQGNFNAETGQVPSMKVSWYKTGGVFDEPTMIGVGEQGREAVMPLENNTAWIKELAYQLGGYISNEGTEFIPVSTTTNTGNSSYYGDTTSYMTNTTGGNTDSHDIQDSHDVTFEKGSIVLQVMNTSEEEAERFANMIMQKVKRKQEIEDMLHYRRR